jgi:FtsP/CotA-like multicopper oxidase with cupredoxin domain
VLNRLPEATAIHWHGIELESYSDGVVGWSGAVRRLAPAIQAQDSFVARLTLPRAGTFMYHTHLNDLEQLTSGLYAAILVLEPGARFDPSRDHVFIGGWDGGAEPPHLLINGDSLPRVPLELEAGVPHRFRFINIGPAGGYWPSLRQDSTLQLWRHIAKDGADLPAARAVERPARFRIQVGETWDFEWTPRPGEYTLALGDRDKPEILQRIVVR